MARTKYWTGILYEEHVPDFETGCKVSFVSSPWHASDDEDLKPHKHVIGIFDSLKSSKQAHDALPGLVRIQEVHDFRTFCRYLIHLDQPEKEQFVGTPESLLTFSGDDSIKKRVLKCFESKQGTSKEYMKIHEIIKDNDLLYYDDLCDCLAVFDEELFEFACRHNSHFRAYLVARAQKDR